MLSRCIAIVSLFIFAGSACSSEFDATISAIKAKDDRNAGIDFSLSRQSESLEFDLISIGTDKSSMDVFRVLLHTAAETQDSHFNEVILAFKGDRRFRLGGEDFQKMGAEFGTQNPMYTLRTFPEKLKTVEGQSAFPQRSGGLLYLARVQMEDFSAFIEQWYFADLKAAYEAELEEGLPDSYDDDDAL